MCTLWFVTVFHILKECYQRSLSLLFFRLKASFLSPIFIGFSYQRLCPSFQFLSILVLWQLELNMVFQMSFDGCSLKQNYSCTFIYLFICLQIYIAIQITCGSFSQFTTLKQFKASNLYIPSFSSLVATNAIISTTWFSVSAYGVPRPTDSTISLVLPRKVIRCGQVLSLWECTP